MTNHMHQELQPPEWAPPKGYANGVAARGRLLFVAGQIGWNAQGQFETDDLVQQVDQALVNVCAVLAQGGGGPQHIVRMTWYVVSRAEYLAAGRAIGQVFRQRIGHWTIAMSAVEVTALMESRAKVEIEVTAVVPE